MANAAARRFFDAGDPRGRSWVDLCPRMTPEIWRRVLDSDGNLRHECERDGVYVLFTHVRSDSGDVVFAYGADITARRRDERLLAEQAAALAEIARFPEMNPGPVLRLDLDANVLLANAAARGVFGGDLIGSCWRDLCPGIDQPTWQGVLDAVGSVPREARIGDREYVFAHRHDPVTRLVFVFGADITAQKQAERARTREERELDPAAMFIFIGSTPHTGMVAGLIELDDKGYVLTGPDLPRASQGRPRGWTLDRDPFLFETSVSGIFAVGDVRAGSGKRVAAAVGEGSATVSMVHRYLQTV
jgi:PAS domain-containing protein